MGAARAEHRRARQWRGLGGLTVYGPERPVLREDAGVDETGAHLGPEEQVASVDDEVHLSAEGRGEGTTIRSEELRAAATTLDAWPDRVVEAEVSVGEKQDLHPVVAVGAHGQNRPSLRATAPVPRAGLGSSRITTGRASDVRRRSSVDRTRSRS